MVFWLITLVLVRRRKKEGDLREFWWASWTCCLLGITEPLYVPEYWSPPSILRFYRWDVESFIFCFAIGGVAAVLTELPTVKKLAVAADRALWDIFGRVILRIKRAYGAEADEKSMPRVVLGRVFPESGQLQKEQHELDNIILVAFFLAMFGTTAQLNLNIIYDGAIVCLSTAGFIWWRRPGLRWQIVGGALSFTLLYAAVLKAVVAVYPDFFSYWNQSQLTHIFIAKAPLEEYVFAFTFGALWAPLYEAWKRGRRAK